MNKSNKIEYLAGSKLIKRVSIEPYNDVVCNFISDLSFELNKSHKINYYPDIKALSFWCRKKNIYNLKSKFLSKETRLGVGLIFHITPSNIPTNFAYSLIFGLVTGNSNIVKVPSKKFEQVDIICKSINKILKKKYKKVKKMISIIRYVNNDLHTNKISSVCDARIIWGGDKSISDIRRFTLKHRSLDIAFADRYSFCVMNTSDIIKLKSIDLRGLTEKFYNDTYQVDQNACSSPHLILWLGKKSEVARLKFWESLKEVVNKKYVLTETASIEKYTKLCSEIINSKNFKSYKRFNNDIYTVSLKSLDKNIHDLRGKWGYFYEFNADSINIMKKFINNKYQTLTYFGLSKKLLKDFVLKNKLNGIDRVVPIGQALDIGFFWDGYDLNKILTRVVEIK